MAKLSSFTERKNGVKGLYKQSIQASSLIENLIALLILTLITGFTLMLIVQLRGHSSFGQKQQARFLLQSFADSSVENHVTEPEVKELEGLHCARRVEPYGIDNKLVVLYFSVYSTAGILLYEERILCPSDHEE